MSTKLQTRQDLVEDVLGFIRKTRLLQNEDKDKLLLACFLKHLYQLKRKFIPTAVLRSVIEDCRGHKLTQNIFDQALDRLVGYHAIEQYNNGDVVLTTVGINAVKNRQFEIFHP